MKKIAFSLLLVLVIASIASAQLLVGSKAGGMGGAGVANVDDLAAAYYNPAALMRSGVKAGELQISVGAGYSDPTSLSSALSKANDAATFLMDNYSESLSFNGNLDGVIGLNIGKVGISVIPIANANVSKSANTLVGTFNISGQYAGVLTLGKTFSVPFLPAALDLGINAKTITAYSGGITTTGTATNASGTRTYGSGSGIGFDIGALTSFNIPMVTNFKAGLAIRNIGQNITYSNKSQLSYLDYSTGTPALTTEAEQTLADTTTASDISTVIGVSALVPGINITLAGDIEMVGANSNTHIGLEYPLLLNTLILRAGTASGNALSKTTIGATISLPMLALDIVSVSDANNAGQTAYILDFSIGL